MAVNFSYDVSDVHSLNRSPRNREVEFISVIERLKRFSPRNWLSRNKFLVPLLVSINTNKYFIGK